MMPMIAESQIMKYLMAALMLCLVSFGAHATNLTSNLANAPGWAPSTPYIGPIWQNKTAPVTAAISSPGVVTWNAHGLGAGTPLHFTTTGALPSGIVAGTIYYVSSAGLTSNSFRIADTAAHAAAGTNSINTTGTQSGVQTAIAAGFGSRVLAGPGYVAGSGFTSGTAVFLWAATNTTSGVSSASGNGPQSCPNPWLTNPGSPTTVTDGTVTWQCMVQINSNDANNTFEDSGVAWATSSIHQFRDIIESNNNLYIMDNSADTGPFVANSPNYDCISKTTGSGPTGTGSHIVDGDVTTQLGVLTNGSALITVASTVGLNIGEGIAVAGSGSWPAPGDGSSNVWTAYIGQVNSSTQVTAYTNAAGPGPSGWPGSTGSQTVTFGYSCQWNFLRVLSSASLYTSQSAYWPQQVYNGGTKVHQQAQGTYGVIQYYIWDGGSAAPEYTDLTTIYNHQTFINDTGTLCQSPNQANQIPGCSSGNLTQVIDIRGAPGDSICDHVGSVLTLGGYNADYGVGFHVSSSSPALYVGETGLRMECLQGKNDGSGLALTGDTGASDLNAFHSNNNVWINFIVDTTGNQGGIHGDGGPWYINGLVIYRGTANDQCLICGSYTPFIANVTAVATNPGSDSTCFANVNYSLDNPTLTVHFNNNYCHGAAHWWAYGMVQTGTPIDLSASSDNAGDLPNTDSNVNITDFPGMSGQTVTTQAIVTPGSGCGGPCYGLTPSAVFVNASGDYRLSISSPVRGAGASFSLPDWSGVSTLPMNNNPDIYDTTRTGSFDIGPYQYFNSGSSVPGVGRRMFH